jgi:hypothetical protein
LQEVVEVEAEDHARKSEVNEALRIGLNLFPVAVLFIDVRAELLAGSALGALGVLRLTEAVRLRVNLLYEGERADVVAPRLARVEGSEDERGH